MTSRLAPVALRLAAAGVPLSLLWDYSWESTIGIDLVWSPPHVATFLAVAMAALAALVLAVREHANKPIGARIVLWGALAFITALLFDRWWQSSYGLAAGIWHPPQLLKAVAFFAAVFGAWLTAPGSALAGGSVLALIQVVTLTLTYANRQHDIMFYMVACGAYPLVLVACSLSGKRRYPATMAALAYTLLVAAMVWLLPLFPGAPLTGPIFHPRDHLLPPPFPLLLVAPALALDILLRVRPGASRRFDEFGRALEAALAFCLVFICVQWIFADILISSVADNRFFAGGGRHWPFFFDISPERRTEFWWSKTSSFTTGRMLFVVTVALLSSVVGIWLGRGVQNQRR